MKKNIVAVMVGSMLLTGCAQQNQDEVNPFDYTVEQFADLQILRYQVHGFDELPLKCLYPA